MKKSNAMQLYYAAKIKEKDSHIEKLTTVARAIDLHGLSVHAASRNHFRQMVD